jgi:hypothetical protein
MLKVVVRYPLVHCDEVFELHKCHELLLGHCLLALRCLRSSRPVLTLLKMRGEPQWLCSGAEVSVVSYIVEQIL